MNPTTETLKATLAPSWQDYFDLCKPKVVLLMLLTAIVGMYLATPGRVSLDTLVLSTTGIALAAFAAAAINHVVDRRIDEIMGRTKRRPLPTGRVTPQQALRFAAGLIMTSMLILGIWVNLLTAALTLITTFGYAIFYTLYLKRVTPQNIVIGGAAGATPPLLGWTAVTGTFDANALLLVLIIYTWTPPHFWSLAIHRYKEYAKANIPMLPVTHGVEFTKLCILLYTLLLSGITLLPFVTEMSGTVYLMGSALLDSVFLYHACKIKFSRDKLAAIKCFHFSNIYLILIFILLLIDHYITTH